MVAMRLFLSSENVGKHPDTLVKITGANKKLAYIANARDGGSEYDRSSKTVEHKVQFENLGFEFVEIDLRKYFDHQVPHDLLDNFGVVWCAGGNTFLLRAAMKLSGFDKIMIRKIKNNEIAYGGSSAGSMLVAPTLKGTERGDSQEEVQKVYKQQITWEGLGLVDFVIIPHWGSSWWGEKALMVKSDLDNQNIPYKLLSDGQVLLIDGDKEELLK